MHLKKIDKPTRHVRGKVEDWLCEIGADRSLDRILVVGENSSVVLAAVGEIRLW